MLNVINKYALIEQQKIDIYNVFFKIVQDRFI